jgi:hypothetical protein
MNMVSPVDDIGSLRLRTSSEPNLVTTRPTILVGHRRILKGGEVEDCGEMLDSVNRAQLRKPLQKACNRRRHGSDPRALRSSARYFEALASPFNCTTSLGGFTFSALVAIANVAVSNWFFGVGCVGV